MTRSLHPARIAAAAVMSLLLVHCGGGNSGGDGAGAGDSAEEDASADVSTPDATGTDATADDSASPGNADTGAGVPSTDATMDARAEADTAAVDASGNATPLDASGNSAPDTGTSDSDANGTSPDASTVDDGGPEAAPDDEDAASDMDAGDGTADAMSGAIPCVVDAGDGGSGCMAGLTCCGGYCVDTTRDPNNCGACGNACSATQFCAAPTCDDAIVKNLCVNPNAGVLQDQFPIDNDAGIEIAVALASCTVPVTFSTFGQNAAQVLDPTTHRPLVGPGTTLIAGGGAFGQLSLGYLDSAGLSPAYIVEQMGNVAIVDRATGTNVIIDSAVNVTPHHDYFLLVMTVEPISGTLSFAAAGTGYPGTSAAGYYFKNMIMPNLPTYGASWYAYEWTDVDMDSLPSAGDTFALQGSGP